MTERENLTWEQTKEKALRLLEFRNHSSFELRKKLRMAGAEDENIDRAIEFCMEYHLINDGEYAKALAKDLANLKKYGKRRIYQELKSRGLSSEDIDAALEGAEDDTDELFSLVAKKLKGNFEKKNRDKAIRYFIYRGYEASDIIDSIERLMADEF